MTLSSDDLRHLADKKITEAQLSEQLDCFVNGFPFLTLEASATAGNGIRVVSDEERTHYIDRWNAYLTPDAHILKFVPASGAASRMFKNLFAFLSSPADTPSTDFERTFFEQIESFAFFGALDSACRTNDGAGVHELVAAGRYKSVVENLLSARGMDYGELPKGLLLFHGSTDGARTALEEHLVEGALYARNQAGRVNIHLTVSPEHQPLFEQLVRRVVPAYEKRFGVRYDISFSTQQPSTDTVAVDMQNQPFREADGTILFRPGGHGALIGNLNAMDADVVFIKNIDNVVPDRMKPATVTYKQLLAGILVDLHDRIADYVRLIDGGACTPEQVDEIDRFVSETLCVRNPAMPTDPKERIAYLRRKLMRPLRVCGMVKNIGEPGGGPFFAVNPDGTISLQILESSQIDMSNPEARRLFEQGTHFNPVDLVCALRDPYGQKYHLPDFVDRNTGFISQKSKDGRELKALELPGLWNGAMSDWNTVFVEVPIETFNPVKTVNDLLRPEHKSE